MLKKENILIVAAHPDDETIGCGGTILKKISQGHKVNLLILTDGISARSTKKLKKKYRTSNFEKVIKVYNFTKVKRLNFPDNSLDTISILSIIKEIEKFIKLIKPDIVFTHSPLDLNIDHEITSRASVTACRPTPGQTIKQIFFFETLSSSEWSINKEKFNPNWFEDINKFIKKKNKILKLYKDEILKKPHTRSVENINNLSKLRGNSVGIKNAEAFELYRNINISS